MFAHISNQQNHSNTQNSPPATPRSLERQRRTNSSEKTFEENIKQFKQRLQARGYQDNLLEKILSDVKFNKRLTALQINKTCTKEFYLL